MHELQRLAYLEAMGVDSYISRQQLPGAAITRRLALVPNYSPASNAPALPPAGPPVFEVPARTAKAAPAAQAPVVTTRDEPAGHFTLVTVLVGDCLWLEDIGNNPMSQEQMWIIQCMARALSVHAAEPVPGAGVPASAAPDVALFQWPIHTNDQFDLGPDSARACVSSFVARRVEQNKCRGLICLGSSGADRLAAAQLSVPVIVTRSTLELLVNPGLKSEVWTQLTALNLSR